MTHFMPKSLIISKKTKKSKKSAFSPCGEGRKVSAFVKVGAVLTDPWTLCWREYVKSAP